MKKTQNSDSQLVSRVLQGGGIALIATLLTKVLTFSSHILMARTLGASSYGIYALAFSLTSIFAVVASLGLGHGIVRYCAIHNLNHDYQRMRGDFLTAVIFTLLGSLSITIVFVVYADVIANVLFKKRQAAQIIRIFALSIPFLSVTTICACFMQSLSQIRKQQGILLSRVLINTPIIIGAYLFGWHLFGLALGLMVSSLLGFGIGAYLVYREFVNHYLDSYNIKWEPIRLIRFSLPVLASGLIYIMLNNIDSIMLGYFNDVQQVGIYNVASRASLLAVGLLSPIGQIVAPIMSELYASQKFHQLSALFQQVTRGILVFSLPILLLVLISASKIMELFGSDFTNSADVLMILSVGQAINIATGPILRLLEMSGKQVVSLIALLGVITVDIFLNIYLIPPYGAVGAAAATAISTVVVFGGLAIVVSNKIFSFRIYSYQLIWPILGFFTALLSVTLINMISIRMGIEVHMLYLIVVALLVYLFINSRYGLTKGDRILFKSIYNRCISGLL